MHQEHYISSTRVVAVTGWVLVASLMLASWVLFTVPGEAPEAACLLAFTACALAPAAAVAHIKVYVMRTTNLIRVINGLPLEGPPKPTQGAGLTRVQ